MRSEKPTCCPFHSTDGLTGDRICPICRFYFPVGYIPQLEQQSYTPLQTFCVCKLFKSIPPPHQKNIKKTTHHYGSLAYLLVFEKKNLFISARFANLSLISFANR